MSEANAKILSKKSQITIFIILGIIIFVIAGLLFYIKNYVKSKEISQETEQLLDITAAQAKYATYMQACLNQATTQGLALVGMQGGVIWDYQANNTKPFLGPKKYDYGQWALPFEYSKELNLFDSSKTIFNISYGIYAPDLSLNLEGHPSVPEYPYGLTKLIEDPTEIDKSYSNVLGNIVTNPLSPLCDYWGSNAPTQEGALFSCETYDSKRKTDNDNVQEYLEAYIASAFENCVALETLPEFANASITAGNVTVTVSFAPTSVTVNAELPLLAEAAGEEAMLSLQTFHAEVDVRLKQMHELATRLIEADTNNIFFNIVRDANELANCKEPGKETEVVTCIKEGMGVVKYRDVCQTVDVCTKYGLYDDVIVIKDEKYTLNGKPYIFAFAVQNRYPALDIIHEENAGYPDYNIVVEEGDTIALEADALEPKGYDPDEDDHGAHDFMEQRYIYGMWKVDYDEVAGVKTNIGAVTDGFTFSDEGRTATYTTKDTGEDRGEHTLQIQACDNEGLCDFQNVKILVLEKTTS